MLNLDEIMNRSIEVKLEGKVLHIKEPSNALFNKLMALQSYNGADIFDKQAEMATELLNRNRESKKFTLEQVKEYPQRVIASICKDMFKFTSENVNDPN